MDLISFYMLVCVFAGSYFQIIQFFYIKYIEDGITYDMGGLPAMPSWPAGQTFSKPRRRRRRPRPKAERRNLEKILPAGQAGVAGRTRSM